MSATFTSYLETLPNIINICENFEKDVKESFFKVVPPFLNPYYVDRIYDNQREYWFSLTPKFLSYYVPLTRIIEITEMFGIRELEIQKTRLNKIVQELQTVQVVSIFSEFSYRLQLIKNSFAPFLDRLRTSISLLDAQERKRLNEGIHCYLESCNLSSAAMSVSAIENRLFRLMAKARPNESRNLGRQTLGQLVQEYLKDQEKYLKIVPERHHALLNLCNRYRIYAVHPKGLEVSRNIAGSILRLTFEFLMDKETLV